ncbi:hypothetical protein H2198_009821 [Neophaeococcomyces mojaviensis]|uniref:Uncharacterized protein n=1 Tax=Neophaeococcomyces mojaviensis TaxID=3383035 RepID=A0ACC2ZTL9_9EURO|nr:hypothetical protein H2198_009821 [Knufia sp. JES_112]
MYGSWTQQVRVLANSDKTLQAAWVGKSPKRSRDGTSPTAMSALTVQLAVPQLEDNEKRVRYALARDQILDQEIECIEAYEIG